MNIIFSAKCLNYGQSGHQESPERVGKTYEFLKGCGKSTFEFVEPEPATEEDILKVHHRYLLNIVKQGVFHNPDMINGPDIYDFALLSAGGAIESARMALEGNPSFSLMRPPGHHAGRMGLEGFCYFNNVAIAVQHALERVGKAAVLDLDVHHGNGTQEIFAGRKDVMYVSLHQYAPFFYPGTGGASEGNCINYPLEPGTGEEKYLETLNDAIEKIRSFKPDVLAVSMGFDTYKNDPLANIKLDIGSYEKIGRTLAEFSKPCFVVLEGGYSEDMPLCVHSFLGGYGRSSTE